MDTLISLLFAFLPIGLAPIAGLFVVIWELYKDEKRAKEKATVPVMETPEQLYTKCCYCPMYATCTKGIDEVRECKR